MKLFLGGLFQETNDFSPIPTGLDSFAGQCWRPRTDPVLPENVSLLGYGGAMKRAQELGIDVVPGLFVSAVPAAPAAASVWTSLKDELLSDLKAAGPVDMVFLFLHGAMSAQGTADCEGDVLAAVRQHVGPDVLLAAVFDLHGNLSAAMMRHADFIISCKEYPHTDFAEQGAKAVDLLLASVGKHINPRSVAVKIPAMTLSPTTSGEMKVFVDRLKGLEKTDGILSASAFHGFFGADHADVGASIVVIANQDEQLAETTAMELADAFIRIIKTQGQIGLGLEDALEKALGEPGTVILADRADNAGGGAGSDSTYILAELLRRGVEAAALGYLWDPVAVEMCHLSGPGTRLKLRIGGKVGVLSGEPLDVDAEVLAVESDIRQSWFGRGKTTLPMGKSAAIRVDGVDIVLGSVRRQVFSRHVFEGHGIKLEEKKLIVVKSTQHFYEAFAPLGRVIYCDAPGTVTMDLSTLPYRNLPRPIWPLDRQSPVPFRLEV